MYHYSPPLWPTELQLFTSILTYNGWWLASSLWFRRARSSINICNRQCIKLINEGLFTRHCTTSHKTHATHNTQYTKQQIITIRKTKFTTRHTTKRTKVAWPVVMGHGWYKNLDSGLDWTQKWTAVQLIAKILHNWDKSGSCTRELCHMTA